MYTLKNYRFSNWARNVKARPEAYFLPENTDDVKAIVQRALAEGRKVRAVGAGHSWSAVAATNHFMVSLDKMNRLVHINPDTLQVTVQGGMRLKYLHRLLYEQDMAMQNIGSISEQSIAGAISTGTHGTGVNYGILASQVLSLKLVNGLGEEVELHAGHDDFKAAAVSLGCIGIITEVTLQCRKAYHVHELGTPTPLPQAISQMAATAAKAEHYKLWWFPHTAKAMVYQYTQVQEPIRDTFAKQHIDDGFVSKYFFRTFLGMGHLHHGFRPTVNKFIGLIFLKNINRVNYNYKVLNVPMPPRHREAEYAFPAAKGPEVLNRLQSLIAELGLKMNFVIEVRYTKADDFYLSACRGQDSCFIGFYFAGSKKWQPYLALFEELAMEYGARPHLGKEFSVSTEYLHRVMPGLEAFNTIRHRYDPKGIFENNFTKKLFDLTP